jgi:hypothetical protein
MTFAIQPALRVQISKSRNSSSPGRRIVLKVLARGLAALAIVCVVMIGMGWLLAVSLQARSDIRSVMAAAPSSTRPARIVLPAGGTANRLAVVASLASPATERAKMPVLDPIGAFALVIPDSFDSPASTGSIAANAGGRPGAPAKPDLRDMPLPRPRLAAMGPVQNLGVERQDDARALRTAIYDITAQTVYLPSGERLEAHSGLGGLMDDPRYVHTKNRGATPPNIYELKLRESLFHGVQAIRLTPVGDGHMFDRDGILAHSYMLGPSGQSNGCVSFKDYPKFLRAYLRGEIDRIAVVSRLARPSVVAARPNIRSANAL